MHNVLPYVFVTGDESKKCLMTFEPQHKQFNETLEQTSHFFHVSLMMSWVCSLASVLHPRVCTATTDR